jgi:hypothetical protein
VYPVLHVHAVITLLPTNDTVFAGQPSHVAAELAATTVEYVCTPQFVHAAGPGATLYLPAEQPVHPPAPAPPSHIIVRSTPSFIWFVIAVIALLLRTSSTKKKPAMSPSKVSNSGAADEPTFTVLKILFVKEASIPSPITFVYITELIDILSFRWFVS